ncbi:MAG: hypothetical protein BIFFINMI_02017 [Phycisphaerae bacterium]|nr:hypothetical protein [Phycisphaerae bacterium]
MAKKRSQLVCQYVENLSRAMLEDYQAVIRDFVRRRSGVYALYRRGKLYYVGLASSLLGRLKHHLRDHHANTWDHFSIYLTVGTAYMKEIESVLIRIADPPGNKMKGRFVKCENLLGKLKGEYRKRRKEEESRLFGGYQRRRRARQESGKTYPLAVYMPRVKKLRARYKGRVIRAWVRRDGRIRLNGKLYPSPSKAAAAACGRRTCNGWHFWRYERAPGDWVRLMELRA